MATCGKLGVAEVAAVVVVAAEEPRTEPAAHSPWSCTGSVAPVEGEPVAQLAEFGVAELAALAAYSVAEVVVEFVVVEFVVGYVERRLLVVVAGRPFLFYVGLLELGVVAAFLRLFAVPVVLVVGLSLLQLF